MADRLSETQRRVLTALDSYRPVRGDTSHGWRRAALFDPRTVRSLIKRGLVQPSTTLEWMIKHNLDDLTLRITPQGEAALKD